MQFSINSIMLLGLTAVACAAPTPEASPEVESAAAQACDPVGCYPDTSFSVLGDFDGNGQITGHLYYKNVETDFKWTCNNHWYGFDSNLPYVFSISESAGLYCDARYDQTYIKYGAISTSMSGTQDCSKTGKYSYRCIFKADGSNGSGL
ncbi:Hypothetical protein R9X50_00347800 [Acrodontium crateriforme]|uniref:Uncharacterized protein n=1 Tax=Acrodontium crateriforme TaxID=150365 RepID=A0AAQ3M3P7_9PEZI|nr:Hypothetical protein R9X50_00347800 [Acrodontium crateriforme]